MNHDKEIFVSSARHLSQEELLSYHHGRMQSADRHMVERHLLDCELCSEALQGVAKMDDTMRLASITHELYSRSLHKKLKRKKIFSLVQIISIVAIFVVLGLLIIFSLLLFRSR